MRLILRPAFSASSRHRCSSFSNVPSSTLSFFNGWRSTPGTIPATSQLDWLISMTAISVPSGSRRLRDRLRSFNFCMECSIGSNQRRWMQHPRRRPPHSISLGGFRTPAARVCRTAVRGRHPKPFTKADVSDASTEVWLRQNRHQIGGAFSRVANRCDRPTTDETKARPMREQRRTDRRARRPRSRPRGHHWRHAMTG